ncbi:MAG TPA: Ig-like domain-containing protein, partial [Lachnospiraceae bacterium]|nr:Ig-like domain-containing protein [Lachnospiraceae bacterium]
NSALTTADSTNTMLAAFETKYSGELPFEIQLQVKVDSKLAGKVLFVSRWNEDKKKYQPLGYSTTSKNGDIAVCIDHFSKYVVTLENPALPTQITKKTVYTGKKFNLQSKITNLLDGDKVFYYSSKKSVASVSESGVITAKKAGTVTITTKVVQSGKAYLYKTKVTVKNSVAK